MSNTFAPFGAQDLALGYSGSPTYPLFQCWIASSDTTAIFNGDLVQNLTVNSSALQTGNVGFYVTQASSGLTAQGLNYYCGVFRYCEYYNSAVGRVVWSQYFPATGVSSQLDVKAYIQIDDQMLYIMQTSTSATAPLGSSNIGMNFTVTANASTGNTATGYSNVQLASSLTTASSTPTYPFRLIDFYSNYTFGGSGPTLNQYNTAIANPTINGVDNSTIGQIVVLMPNGWMTRTTTGSTG